MPLAYRISAPCLRTVCGKLTRLVSRVTCAQILHRNMELRSLLDYVQKHDTAEHSLRQTPTTSSAKNSTPPASASTAACQLDCAVTQVTQTTSNSYRACASHGDLTGQGDDGWRYCLHHRFPIAALQNAASFLCSILAEDYPT